MTQPTTFETGPAIHDLFGNKPAPRWYHPYGTKMHIAHVDVERRALLLSSPNNVARLSIKPLKLSPDEWGWAVRWYLKHSQSESFTGRIVWHATDLQNAFAVETDERLTVHPGRYIRQDGYLNLPGFGYDHKADWNLSTEITSGMQAAVRAIMRLPNNH